MSAASLANGHPPRDPSPARNVEAASPSIAARYNASSHAEPVAEREDQTQRTLSVHDQQDVQEALPHMRELLQDVMRRAAQLLEHAAGSLGADRGPTSSPDSGASSGQEEKDAWKEILRGLRIDVHETARAVLMCFHCEHLVHMDKTEAVITEALLGNAPRCSKCSTELDVWKNTLYAMTAPNGGLAMAAQVGARHTSIAYRLAIGQTVRFDVRDKGVPADAVILRITHSASLGENIAVVDLDATDSARAPGYEVRVLGVQLGASDTADMQASTNVTWAHHDADDDGRRSLNRALLALADGRLEEAIVPANVAVEVTLANVLQERLRALGISEKRIKPFLTEAATYSHQLNVLLPVVLAGTGAPPLSDDLRGILNRLRDLRNSVGHWGKAKAPLTREIVGECVAGAVFGFHYVRLAAEFLGLRRDLAGPPP